MALEVYRMQGTKKLRCGYTTGTCAALAVQAAARALLLGERPAQASLTTPKGILVTAQALELEVGPDWARCAVQKDAGDDADVTDGILIYALLRRRPGPIVVDGGEGVGRVTKPGLDQPVGAAAINSVPRRMIRENLEEACALADWSGGLEAVISVPEGERLAKKTFNPRLGIAGGISILGTTGIVEPMSDGALVGTIRAELSQRRAAGDRYVLLTPGNYGSEFIRDGLGLDPALAVQTSNFIGDALDLCRELGFSGALLVGHVGKLVKLAGGMLNTHSRWGDCRMEILAAHAGAAGAPPERLGELLECAACDDALRILREAGVYRETLERVTRRAAFHLSARAGEDLEVGTVLFSKVYGILGRTENAEALLNCIRSCPLGRRQ